MPISSRNFLKPFSQWPEKPPDSCVVGIDGCRAGWCAVTIAGPLVWSAIFPAWRDVLDWFGWQRPRQSAAPQPLAIAVDMPIGLVSSGRRPCDRRARSILAAAGGGRPSASSIFAPPRRPMLRFETYEAANAWGKAQGPLKSHGGGLSRQAWNLIGKIREIDAFIAPGDQNIIFEAHPELAFLHRNGFERLAPKRSATGRSQRKSILESCGLPVDAILEHTRNAGGVKDDDILDASVLALVAQSRARGVQAGERGNHAMAQENPTSVHEAKCASGEPATDDRGLRMEIWY